MPNFSVRGQHTEFFSAFSDRSWLERCGKPWGSTRDQLMQSSEPMGIFTRPWKGPQMRAFPKLNRIYSAVEFSLKEILADSWERNLSTKAQWP